ncbi:hypothetical protein B0T18DRAFT_399070 [Schizothecium vesticola]|uniref:Uncharacterized protein n=1 Tax=Schizothecium vesticola TaxID=314040 RepID=A0AA40FAS5_9PEZI|nr:hypothetical protein B0T18DRAFT_399070 [Schizothecium vesticola]
MLPCTSIAVRRTFHPIISESQASQLIVHERELTIFPALPRRQGHRPEDLRRPASHPRQQIQLRRADRPGRFCRRHLPDHP